MIPLYMRLLPIALSMQITFANPGYRRTGKIQMLKGGVSDPRNRG